MVFESTGIPDGFFRWLFVFFGLYENVDGVNAIRICAQLDGEHVPLKVGRLDECFQIQQVQQSISHQLAFGLEGTILRKAIAGTKPALDAEEKLSGMGWRGSLI